MRQSRPNRPTRWEPRWTRLLGEASQPAEKEDLDPAADASAAEDETMWRAEERPRGRGKALAGVWGIVLAPVVAALVLWHVAGMVIAGLSRPGDGRAVAGAVQVTPTPAARVAATPTTGMRSVVTIPIATPVETAPATVIPATAAAAATAVPATAVPTQAPRGTPSPTAAPQVAQAIQSHRSHLVERGDTLFSIARRNGTTVNALVAANGLGSAEAVLSVGKRLVIP